MLSGFSKPSRSRKFKAGHGSSSPFLYRTLAPPAQPFPALLSLADARSHACFKAVQDPLPDTEVLEFLESFLTPERREKIHRVLAARTRFVRVVLEDLFQPHNASAVMRSCECLGVQHLHVIENKHRFAPNRDIALGSAKWMSLHRHRGASTDNTLACLTQLKDQGYRLVATCLRKDARPLEELPVNQPFALLFGTEETGLSERALEMADEAVTIPMYGFTQSYNISVSVAICLAELLRRIRSTRDDWALGEEEQLRLRDRWVRRSLKTPGALERRFLEERALGERR